MPVPINAPTPKRLTVVNDLLVSGGTAGATTGWVRALPVQERFMASLTSAGTASVTLDGSNDGVNSAAQIGTWSLDTNGQQVITPPIKSPYPYVRMTVVSASAPVNLGRGA